MSRPDFLFRGRFYVKTPNNAARFKGLICTSDNDTVTKLTSL